MKRLLRILFVKREETKDRWWDRLFYVLLGGTSILLLLLSIFLTFTLGSFNDPWVSYRPVAFSLEPNYKTASGKELSCIEDYFAFNVADNEPMADGEGIKCDGVVLSESDSRRYVALYHAADENLQKQYGLDKYYADTSACPPSTAKLSDCVFNAIMKSSNDKQADPSYSKYQDNLKNLARIKVTQEINFGVILRDLASWTLIPILLVLLWVLFWSSVVYRATLYVIYGKKAKSS